MILTLISKYLVQKAFEYVQIFEKASGLCLNEDKTQGYLYSQATFVKHQIGHTLSNLFNLNQLNHLPHEIIPSPYYRHKLDVIKKYNITKKELECGKIKTIYTRIIDDLPRSNYSSNK